MRLRVCACMCANECHNARNESTPVSLEDNYNVVIELFVRHIHSTT